ncbi:MAG: hypothetical protein U9N85_11600, partial [Bacteroidota bacterium]|nr:hypothetical protein [Bacteroidota bacterium]
MTAFSENIDFKSFADFGCRSHLFSDEPISNVLQPSPLIVPPFLMPGNLFPDPAQKIINSIQSSQASESPVTEKTTASLESPDAQESDNSKVNHPVHDIADIFRLYWKDYQSSNPVTERHYKVV